MLRSSPGYLRHVDGLRGLAVVLVVLFHFRVYPVTGGYVGVDVFFVISGFLIIKVIVGDLERGQFSLVDFWSRRLRRLAPAAAMALLVALGVGFLTMTPSDYAALASNNLLALTSLTNLSLVGQTGYFADSVIANPLLHFWSLAVEAQFYFVFPPLGMALFLVAGRHRGRKLTIFVLLILGLTAFASGEVLLRFSEKNAAFYLMPSRFGQLAFGGILALVMFGPGGHDRLKPPLWLCDFMTLIGLGGITFSALTYSAATSFPGIAAIPVTASSLLLIAFGGRGRLRGLLANSLAEYIGRMSFALYLLHWPAYAFFSYFVSRELTPIETGGVAVGVVVASVLLHHFVENPVLRSRMLAGRRMFYFIAPTVAATAVISLVIVAYDGVPGRVPEARRDLLADAHEYHRVNFGGAGFPQLQLVKLGSEGAEPEFILIGDSKARQFAFGVDRLLAQQGRAGLLYADDGCAFHTANGLLYDGAFDRGCLASAKLAIDLARSKELPLIAAMAWSGYAERLATLNGQPMAVDDAEYARINADMLRALADANEHRAKIYVVANNDGFQSSLPVVSCLLRPSFLGLPCARLTSFDAVDHKPEEVERQMVAILRRDPRFVYLLMSKVFCFEGTCSQVGADGAVLFSDPGHLSKDGAILLAPRLLDLVGL